MATATHKSTGKKSAPRKSAPAASKAVGQILVPLMTRSKSKAETKTADNKGRVAFGVGFANKSVIVEHVSDTEILISLARVIPEREAWLYENPEALASVRRGLAQVKAGEFVEGPDLNPDAEFAKQLKD